MNFYSGGITASWIFAFMVAYVMFKGVFLSLNFVTRYTIPRIRLVSYSYLLSLLFITILAYKSIDWYMARVQLVFMLTVISALNFWKAVYKKCPNCKERIKQDALKCKHCHSALKEENVAEF